jgi:hypothetical protein
MLPVQVVPHFNPHAAEEGAANAFFYRLDSGAGAGGQGHMPSGSLSYSDMQGQMSMLELLGLLRAVRFCQTSKMQKTLQKAAL